MNNKWKENFNIPRLQSEESLDKNKQMRSPHLFSPHHDDLKLMKSVPDLRTRHMDSPRSLHRTVLMLRNTSVAFIRHRDDEESNQMLCTTECCCCGEQVEMTDENIYVQDDSKKTKGEITPSVLSWRELHISRAKLQAVITTSELIFGFAMIGLVELQINKPTNVPECMFILFSANTSFLVIIHILSLMISTFILPNIDTVKSLHPNALIDESPHVIMRWFIDIAWVFSTMLGIFLFLFEVVLFSWLKFRDFSFSAALSSTVFMVLSISVFIVLALYFYHSMNVYIYDHNDVAIRDLELTNESVNNKNDGK